MQWLHPWAIVLGGLAAAIPLAVHFLTRPRPVRFPLSTIRFVREAIWQRRARHRLRDFLVLALRCLAALLLGLTIARLQLGQQPLISANDAHDAVRIVLLDVSQSMAAGQHGIQTFERARSTAAKYLSFRNGLEVGVVLAGAAPQPLLDKPTQNVAALRDELARVQLRPDRLNIQAALNRASEMLSQTPLAAGARRELIVISDFQRSNWSTADFSPLPTNTRIQLESVAPAEAFANMGILRVESQGRAEPGKNVRIEVEVGNYGPAPRQARVELRVGELTFQIEGLCPPGGSATLFQEVEPRTTGWQLGEARLLNSNDVLPADDVRPLALDVRRPAMYTLVTREPATLRPSSSYYVERALVPVTSRAEITGQKVQRVDPLHVTREALVGADLIVLDHPGKLATDAIGWLANFMRRGRAVLYIAAEPVDATNLKLIADAVGAGLQMPVDFTPPPSGQPRRDLFLTEVRRGERPWNVFADELPAVMGLLRFGGGLSSRRREEALQDDVLATYSDRSASLVVTACDAGSLAVWNADLAQSTLPRSTAFVPLVGELVERLLEQHQTRGILQPGEAFAVYLPPELQTTAGLTVATPGAGVEGGELIEERAGVLWRIRSARFPGIYRVMRGSDTVFATPCLLSPQESDLRPLDVRVLTNRLAGGRPVYFRSAASEKSELDDRWSWFAVACVSCLLLEFLTLRSFRT